MLNYNENLGLVYNGGTSKQSNNKKNQIIKTIAFIFACIKYKRCFDIEIYNVLVYDIISY